MKKFVFVFVLLVSISSYAYGYNDDSDSFIEFIYIVFCVLQIILFYKIWKMTDDVKAIKVLLSKKNLYSYKDSIPNTNEIGKPRSVPVKRKDTKPLPQLEKQFIEECKPIFNETNQIDDFKRKAQYVVKKYNDASIKMGSDYDFSDMLNHLWVSFIKGEFK